MNRIREIRKRRGITQKQLADALQVTESAVSHWEKGRRDPDLETLLKIGEVLECSVDSLLGRDATTVDDLSEYLTALINSPERRKLLDLTMWMPKDKLEKLIKLVEVWNE